MTLPAIRAALKRSLMNTSQDIFSGGGEEGLYSLQRVLTDAGRFGEARMAGFFRPDAAISFVFVSDEGRQYCKPFSDGTHPGARRRSTSCSATTKDCVRPLVSFPSLNEHSCRDDDGHRNMRNFFDKKWEGIRFKTLVSPETVPPITIRSLVIARLASVRLFTLEKFQSAETKIVTAGRYVDASVALANGVAIDMLDASYEPGLTKVGELMADKMGLLHDFKISRTPL